MNLTAKEKRFLRRWSEKVGLAAELKQEGLQEGWQGGLQEGWQGGLQEGWQEGWQGGRQEGVQELLEYLKKGHSIGEAEKMFLAVK
jgi:flagellar biosynthesis/type III secretory pathway protein FliH